MEAVKQAKSLLPDVVIMDVLMPIMNGVDAARIIREEVPESRILIISQDEPSIVQRQTMEAKATVF